jgi:hypothetical protein
LQLLDSILHKHTPANAGDSGGVAADDSMLHVASAACSEETAPTSQGRPLIADPRARLSVHPMATWKGPLSAPSGRWARFARVTFETTAIFLLLAAATFAAVVIWHFYLIAPWTQDGIVRVQFAEVSLYVLILALLLVLF